MKISSIFVQSLQAFFAVALMTVAFANIHVAHATQLPIECPEGYTIVENECVPPEPTVCDDETATNNGEEGDCQYPDPAPEVMTIVAHKIVCTNESQLPNWASLPNGGPDITESTAQDWVDTHDSCSFAEGWNFQWGPHNAADAGNTFIGEAGGNWHTFGPTDGDGMASVELDANDIHNQDNLWVREALKNNYIPFTYRADWEEPNIDNVSAEIYCDSDVKNYDNYDKVVSVGLGNTVNCVAWNVPTVGKITIKKLVTQGSNALLSFLFSFTGDNDGFSLSDGQEITEDTLQPGSYTVAEVVPEGWEAPSVSCVSDDADENDQADASTSKTIDLAPAEHVTCTFTNTQTPVQENSACEIGNNLLSNGSFETPVVNNDANWDIFANATAGLNWVVTWAGAFVGAPETANIELHRGVSGWTASDGSQYAELDSDWGGPSSSQTGEEASSRIAQTIGTQVGATYELKYDFSPRPNTNTSDNSIEAYAGGSLIDSATADGTSNTNTSWSTRSAQFVATGASTEIAFKDAGTPNSVGTFVDNAVLCLVRAPHDGGGDDGDKDTYRLEGHVWNDANGNGETIHDAEEDEGSLAGWTITATDGETVFSTTTDPQGNYYFDVPAGTWTITDGSPEGWNQTFPINEGDVHVVTVPVVLTQAKSSKVFAAISNFLVPTVFAATLDTVTVDDNGLPLNFGNIAVVGCTVNCGNNGGGGNGVRISLHSGGSSSSSNNTPEGQVLGASTDAMPVGAPNTGAGGTSPVVVSLPTLSAILTSNKAVQKSK